MDPRNRNRNRVVRSTPGMGVLRVVGAADRREHRHCETDLPSLAEARMIPAVLVFGLGVVTGFFALAFLLFLFYVLGPAEMYD